MKAIFAGIALVWTSAAYAEPEFGTARSSGYPKTRNGELIGCEIDFTNLHWDSAYQHNRMVVSGSISIYQMQGSPSFGFKVVVEDLIENGPNISAKPSTPASIILVAPNGRSTKDIKFLSEESDTPGGRINAYGFSDQFTEIITSIVENQSAVILFNRRPDGLDVRVPVDFTVASTDSEGKKTINHAAISNFVSCTRTLLQGTLEASPK